MKVFVADVKPEGYVNEKDYHWCDNNDLLMFGQFQLENTSSISMCGIKSRKFTTHIVVKDLNISRDFYKELIMESIENAMNCEIDANGNYSVDVGFNMHFNIDELVDELLEKANYFNNDQKVKCFGRTLSPL